ncbi:MAG: hypothetical protein Q9P01_08195 [Anaerolineae bacterium]|nr:hypothetical protein [Anaerolineae bacterium]MDQ7034804.1 hypothetical protein [Anaerolineae bacterium]
MYDSLKEELEDLLDEFEEQKSAINEALESRFQADESATHLDDAFEYLESWQELIKKIHWLEQHLRHHHEQTAKEIREVIDWWYKNHSPDNPAPFRLKNDPSMYDKDLFGNVPE